MDFDEQRREMVHGQLQARGITDQRIVAAFLKVPRHRFVPTEGQPEAYADHPVPIGSGQTVSQPYMVALMTQLLRLQGHERILEIGTGSGYQLAILAELALDVYSVERLPELADQALQRLNNLGYLNIHITMGNGSLGWPAHAPYDGIIVAAGAPNIPQSLVDQLVEGGRLVIPIGTHQAQMLIVGEKRGGTLHTQEITSCMFVPLIGEHGWTPDHG